MTLRLKTFIVVGLLFAGLLAAVMGLSTFILRMQFAKLESAEINADAERIIGVLQYELSSLNAIVGDWAPWDDSYDFIQDVNQDYIASNLPTNTFVNFQIHVMLFYDVTGRLVYGKAVNTAKQVGVAVPGDLLELLAGDGENAYAILLQHKDTVSSHTGVVSLSSGYMLVASQPILRSNGEGPIRGTLIMGRYLDEEEIKKLAALTALPIHIYGVKDAQIC